MTSLVHFIFFKESSIGYATHREYMMVVVKADGDFVNHSNCPANNMNRVEKSKPWRKFFGPYKCCLRIRCRGRGFLLLVSAAPATFVV